MNKIDWADKVAQHIFDQGLKIIETQEQNHGPELARRIAVLLVAKILSASIYKELSRKTDKPCSKEEALKFAQGNYLNMKTEVGHAVAAAFQSALGSFSGNEVEYYCLIKPVPNPVNKLSC